jgi:putative ABC transport system permease protein
LSLETHAIGIQMALGAPRRGVLAMVLAREARLLALGIILGELASLVLTRLLSSEVWGVSVRDPLTQVSMGLVIAAAGVLACKLPARKVSRRSHGALRYE